MDIHRFSARRVALPLILAGGSCGISNFASAQTFTWLGTLPDGGLSNAGHISGDGATVVGYVPTPNGDRAFRWTAAEGMQDLGASNARAWGVNGDGSVIVGSTGGVAFRWTATDGVQGIGTGTATAVSADGAVVAGFSDSGAFRWTTETGMQYIGGNNAHGISDDGLVIVGSFEARAFRWTSESGIVSLGAGTTLATAANADGSVIVGYWSGDPTRVFRWTAADGVQDLGLLMGVRSSYGAEVSDDGNLLVGHSVLPDGSEHAILWQRATGIVDLNTLLPRLGVDLQGAVLKRVDGLSADGLTIAGDSTHGGWMFTLPQCAADFNTDFLVNSQDFFDFVTAFFAGDAAADFDRSGTVDSADFFAFLGLFLNSCT